MTLTVVGFANHATLGNVPRLLATTAAFLVAWALVAPWYGLFREPLISSSRKVWMVFVAWAVAAPIGALLRSLLLGRSTVIVQFVLVVIAVNGLGLVAWRLLYTWRTRTPGD